MMLEKYYFYLLSLLIGCSVMSIEMLGARYLNSYFGSSLYTWAAVISSVLTAIALGNFLGGYVSDKSKTILPLSYSIIISSFYILFIPYLNNNLVDLISKNTENIIIGSLISSLILFLVPLILISFYSPYIIKHLTNIHSNDVIGKISGTIYGLSTLGSIIGTLLTTIYLIPKFGVKEITTVFSTVIFISGVTLIIYHYLLKNKEETKIFKKIIFVIIFIYSIIFTFFNSSTVKKNVKEIIRSPYSDIIIREEKDLIIMEHLLNDKDLLNTSRAYRNRPIELVFPYTQTFTVALNYLNKLPDKILMVGLGGGTTSTYLKNYLKTSKIDIVEIDEKVKYAAKKYFKVEENENYKIHINDGRTYLSKSEIKYDIVYIDSFLGKDVPFHLTTTEFFSKISNSQNSILVINLHLTRKLTPSIVKTLQRNYNNIDTYKADNNLIVIAYNGEKKEDEILENRARELQNKYKFTHNMHGLLERKISYEIDEDAIVLSDNYSPVEFLNSKQKQKK